MTFPHPAPCDLHDTGKNIIDLRPGEAVLLGSSRIGMVMMMRWLRDYKQATGKRFLVRAAGWCRYYVWRAV